MMGSLMRELDQAACVIWLRGVTAISGWLLPSNRDSWATPVCGDGLGPGPEPDEACA